MGSHFGVGEFSTHFRTYFSVWMGMLTGGTIWLLTHGYFSPIFGLRDLLVETGRIFRIAPTESGAVLG